MSMIYLFIYLSSSWKYGVQKITNSLERVRANSQTFPASFNRNVSRRKRNKEKKKERKREREREREKKNSFWNGRYLTGPRVELQSPRPGSDELRSWRVARESRRDRKRQGWIKKPHVRISIIAIPVRTTCMRVSAYNGYKRMCSSECVSTELCARDSSKIISSRQVGKIHSRGARRRAATSESRYYCSAASKLRRVHGVHTTRDFRDIHSRNIAV